VLCRAEVQILDQVVAVVEDAVVLSTELRERLESIRDGIKARGLEQPPEDVLIRETLDALILESIQLQLGKRAGVRISDSMLDSAMQRIAASNQLSLTEFRAAITGQGGSYDMMRQQVLREMIIQRVQSGNVNRRIQITDQEITNFLETDDGQRMIQPEYRIIQGLLAISQDENKIEKKKKKDYADKLLKRISKGESFEKVISEADEYTFSGGDLGWRKLEDLPSIFVELAPTLDPGKTIKTTSPNGIHLVYMAESRGREKTITQTKASHILVKTSEVRTEVQAKNLLENIRSEVKNGKEFSDLARQHSEDIGSASEGGKLGWIRSGQMVPEFENTMDSTEVGAISIPFKSQFGWHILKVDGREEKDITDEMKRNKIAEFLHNRKYQEELDAWLQKIRDEAFVDIK
tara:strand:- start:300 stop:1517 length:1218 start_codon:yes stop_codon:yes gene_type:complete